MMGGSGGGSFSWDKIDPKDINRDLRKKTSSVEYENEVAGFLTSLLVTFNDRDIAAINTHLEEIRKALEKEIEGTVDLNYGGSVAKHTYVDGLSDVDSLVVLNKSELENKSSEEVRDYFYSRLCDRFPNSKIEKGTLAVTVKFGDIDIQLLPALKRGKGFQIADASGTNWSNINPKNFSQRLSNLNQKMGNKLVPTIKLAKAINFTLPEKRRLSGYHTEALAVEIFRDYGGRTTTKEMLKYFFKEAGKRVQTPIVDKTGQSSVVDAYLGGARNLNRGMVSDSLSRIARRLEKADLGQNLDGWKQIFDL